MIKNNKQQNNILRFFKLLTKILTFAFLIFISYEIIRSIIEDTFHGEIIFWTTCIYVIIIVFLINVVIRIYEDDYS